MTATTRALLRTTLQVAVPLWIDRLQQLPWEDVQARAHRAAQIVASQGDVLQFRGKPGESATAFNALAEGLAALAFCPGGVTFLDDHWEATHVG